MVERVVESSDTTATFTGDDSLSDAGGKVHLQGEWACDSLRQTSLAARPCSGGAAKPVPASNDASIEWLQRDPVLWIQNITRLVGNETQPEHLIKIAIKRNYPANPTESVVRHISPPIVVGLNTSTSFCRCTSNLLLQQIVQTG